MESKSRAIFAGLFSIGLLVLAGLFAYWLSKDDITLSPYTIATNMKISGLNTQATVRYKGLKVGKVTDIVFDQKKMGQLLIRLEIVSHTPITQSTYATLGYQGVTGIAYIELEDDGSKPIPIIVDPKLGARIPLRPGLLQKLEERSMAILVQTEEVAKRLNLLLDKNNQESLINTVAQIGKTAKAWEVLPKQLEYTINSMQPVIKQANASFTSFQAFSDNAKKTSANFNQLLTNLQKSDGVIEQFSQSVKQVSQQLNNETLPNITAISQEARSTLRSINRTSNQLSTEPQSLLFGKKSVPAGPGEIGFASEVRSHVPAKTEK